jgi:DNA-binding NarL/FixJ family response regulator
MSVKFFRFRSLLYAAWRLAHLGATTPPKRGASFTSFVRVDLNQAAPGKMDKPVVRVLVVDDHEPFRRFLCTTLQARPELHVVGEASDGVEAVQRAEELQPDLIFLDIGMPRLNGLEAASRISRLIPAAKILLISQENDADVIAAALSDGAKGYVLKLDASLELLPALESVLRGEQFTSNAAASFQQFLGLRFN